MASAFEVFRQAERVEVLASSVYGLLARRFRGQDDEAASLFARLEEEELQHASRVKLLASAYQHDSKLLDRVNGADALDACLAAAERALGEVQAGGWGALRAEVLEHVARFEEQLAAAHANLLAQNAKGTLREFFEQLARMDEGHALLLRR